MKQNKQIRRKNTIEDQLANYISVITGLKDKKTHDNLDSPSSLGLSSKNHDRSEFPMNNKPVIINSEEQIRRRSYLREYTPAVTGYFGDAARLSIGSQPSGLNNSTQPSLKL